MSNLKCFTTKEVARLCRVSDATVKRWEDAGLLKSERTNGGHRRFQAEEVARFQRENKIGLKRCHGDDSIIKTNFLRRNFKYFSNSPLFAPLINACETEAADLLIGELLRKKSPAEIFDKLICPAMREIGELWARGILTVAEEHLATRTAGNAIHKFRAALPVSESSGKLAMCCAVEGDFHELPTFLAQVIFENEGWEVMNFGANMPLDCLAKEVLKHKPEAVCISATFIENIGEFAEKYKQFAKLIEKAKSTVIFGGKAFSNHSNRKFFPNAVFVKKFSDLAIFCLKSDSEFTLQHAASANGAKQLRNFKK